MLDPFTHPWCSILDDSGLRPKFVSFVNVSWSEHTTAKLNISQTTYNLVESGRTRIGRTCFHQLFLKNGSSMFIISWADRPSYLIFLVSHKRIGQFSHVMVAYQFPGRCTRRLDWRHKKLLELANFKRSCSTQLLERCKNTKTVLVVKKSKTCELSTRTRCTFDRSLGRNGEQALKSR